MSLNRYTIGQGVRIKAWFKDEDDAPFDPDTVTFTVRKPNGEEVELTPVNPSTGYYYALVTVDMAGFWWRKVKSSGGEDSASEARWRVPSSKFSQA